MCEGEGIAGVEAVNKLNLKGFHWPSLFVSVKLDLPSLTSEHQRIVS